MPSLESEFNLMSMESRHSSLILMISATFVNCSGNGPPGASKSIRHSLEKWIIKTEWWAYNKPADGKISNMSHLAPWHNSALIVAKFIVSSLSKTASFCAVQTNFVLWVVEPAASTVVPSVFHVLMTVEVAASTIDITGKRELVAESAPNVNWIVVSHSKLVRDKRMSVSPGHTFTQAVS